MVTLALNRESNVSCGDVIAYAGRPVLVADRFAAHMLWMDDDASVSNRAYRLKIGTRTVNTHVTTIKHKVDVNTLVTVACGMLDFALRLAANVHWVASGSRQACL
ncbi:hypothetical protein ISS97_14325 [Dyella koreensis]|uniref:GTP-eEF1A C-terminal domain-containing protein n=1 Tax=Dyella koreensis TaxID=311235 RepID=A0ABW8K6B8_9GAMM